MQNPISEKARGVLYVVAIVISAIAVPAAVIFPDQSALIAAGSAAVGGAAAMLARSNLSSPSISLTAEQVIQVATKVWDRYVDHAATFPALDSAVPPSEVSDEPSAQALAAGV